MELTVLPMEDWAAYAPGPGTWGLRLARSAEGLRNRLAVPKENAGGLTFLLDTCLPKPGVTS